MLADEGNKSHRRQIFGVRLVVSFGETHQVLVAAWANGGYQRRSFGELSNKRRGISGAGQR